jgi:hypothetical protein
VTLDDYHKLEADARQAIEVTDAAAAMAERRWHDPPLPKAARIWTGVLAGRRAFRGQAVVLPDKTIGYIYGIQRGMAALWRHAPFAVGEREYFVLRVGQIKPYRLPSAARLGRCKRGVKEQPSARKLFACRANGAQPCHPGKRRGRPRRA